MPNELHSVVSLLAEYFHLHVVVDGVGVGKLNDVSQKPDCAHFMAWEIRREHFVDGNIVLIQVRQRGPHFHLLCLGRLSLPPTLSHHSSPLGN